MAEHRILKTVQWTLAVFAIGGLLTTLIGRHVVHVRVPAREKLADCTSDHFSFAMAVRYRAPYGLVLGLPLSSTEPLEFGGELQIRRGTEIVARIPVNSERMERCDWLEPKSGLAGYVLSWPRTQRTPPLNEVLTGGQSYVVKATFSHSPPQDSSLWLFSMR